MTLSENKPRVADEFTGLGEHLIRARLRRGLTQRELAKRCALSQSDVSRIEKGERAPSLAQLSRLARALRVPVQWFLTGADRPGLELDDIGFELQALGMVDLHVARARVPGAFRPPEQILALVVAGGEVKARLVEAVPAVLAWNDWDPRLLEAFASVYDRRGPARLGWLADVARSIHRHWGFPGGCPAAERLDAYLRRTPFPTETDSLGYGEDDGPRSPIWRRWKITYPADLDTFRKRAEHLASMRGEPLPRRAAPGRAAGG